MVQVDKLDERPVSAASAVRRNSTQEDLTAVCCCCTACNNCSHRIVITMNMITMMTMMSYQV